MCKTLFSVLDDRENFTWSCYTRVTTFPQIMSWFVRRRGWAWIHKGSSETSGVWSPLLQSTKKNSQHRRRKGRKTTCDKCGVVRQVYFHLQQFKELFKIQFLNNQEMNPSQLVCHDFETVKFVITLKQTNCTYIFKRNNKFYWRGAWSIQGLSLFPASFLEEYHPNGW